MLFAKAEVCQQVRNSAHVFLHFIVYEPKIIRSSPSPEFQSRLLRFIVSQTEDFLLDICVSNVSARISRLSLLIPLPARNSYFLVLERNKQG